MRQVGIRTVGYSSQDYNVPAVAPTLLNGYARTVLGIV